MMAEIEAIRERWQQAPPGPWRWDDQPDGVIRVWLRDDPDAPSAGYEPTIACLMFPGDMETYEGADLRLADAIAAAPSDIAALLAEVDRLRGERAETPR